MPHIGCSCNIDKSKYLKPTQTLDSPGKDGRAKSDYPKKKCATKSGYSGHVQNPEKPGPQGIQGIQGLMGM